MEGYAGTVNVKFRQCCVFSVLFRFSFLAYGLPKFTRNAYDVFSMKLAGTHSIEGLPKSKIRRKTFMEPIFVPLS